MRCIRGIRGLRAREGSSLLAIALYTDAERDAPFVRHADLAHRLAGSGSGGGPYLDHETLMRALEATGADAVWPGWGFVAEDPAFADRVRDAGMCFIGPGGETMRAVGAKICAKRVAQSVHVPVAPWCECSPSDIEGALRESVRIGFPLLVKPSDGEGGRGIRRVERASDLVDALGAASSAARATSGDAALFLERMISGAREIEVQIAGDRDGVIVCLGSSDGSAQRGYRKLVSEGPPPGLPDELQEALEQAAVRIAEHVNYVGLGTVEFLVGPDGFYFLEVNPRLQAGHGVTEELTGLDLIHLQIRIARGESLAALRFRAHGATIGVRVRAEDPEAGFLPAPGRVVRFDPGLGPGIRVDTGVVTGSEIPAAFDPLVARVIARGESREDARARLISALTDFDLVVRGGSSNKGYLVDLLEAEEFRLGRIDTGWLERRGPERREVHEHAGEALLAAAILAYRRQRAADGAPRQVPSSAGHEIDLSHRGLSYRLRVLGVAPDRYRVHLGDESCVVDWHAAGAHEACLRIGGRALSVLYDSRDGAVWVEIEGRARSFGRPGVGEVRAAARAASAADGLARVHLPPSADPLERLLGFDDAREPGVPEGSGAGVDPSVALVRAAREEIRHVLLGYDACPDRTERLAAWVAAFPFDSCPEEVLSELAEARGELKLFADVEELFIRTPHVSGSGRLEPSNHERFCNHLARSGLETTTLDPDLRRLVDAVLAQLGITQASPGAEREEALLRLLGSRSSPGPRSRLVLALIGAVAALARCREDLVAGVGLEETLLRVASMRDHLPSAIADAAAAAHYVAFDRRSVARRAERITRRLEAWFAALEDVPEPPSALALRELVAAPRAVFDRVGRWLDDPDPRRRAIAQAAHLRRLYATIGIEFYSWRLREETWIERLDLADGRTVIGAAAWPQDLVRTAERLCDEVTALTSRDGCTRVHAVELLLHPREESDSTGLATWLHAVLRRRLADGGVFANRITLTVLRGPDSARHYTFVPSQERVDGPQDLHGLHPEIATRVGLGRLAAFELERVALPTDAVCFLARSREVGSDERIVALGEVRGWREAGEGRAEHTLGALEGALLDAAAAVREARAARDPGHRLHCNRIELSVSPGLPLEREGTQELLRRLAPALRHLGLEKVVLSCHLLDSDSSEGASVPAECQLAEAPGGRAELSWRGRSDAPLSPASPHELAVAEAHRRGLVHPYEIVRMLVGDGRNPAAEGGATPLPAPGTFEEFDLAPGDPVTGAVSVAGRPYGMNTSSVVFGIVSTPTQKEADGMERVLILSDPTMSMGSLGGAECDRIVAAIDLAERRKLPVEWVPISSGVRASGDGGTENLDASARVARRIIEFTQAGGVIHVIVHGVNVGAQSHFNSLATMLMHTRGAIIMTPHGSMALTERSALGASADVPADDGVATGGLERIMGLNGEADYYARDLFDAYRILFEHYRFTYIAPGESRPKRDPDTDPAGRDVSRAPYPDETHGLHGLRTVGEVFDAASRADGEREFSMRAVMQGFIDRRGGNLERWSSMAGAENAIVWDAHVGGLPVCLIGIEGRPVSRAGEPPPDGPSSWTSGTLFASSSRKIARALNAASGNRPVVVLANLAAFDGSPESLRGRQLEYEAEIARALVNFRGPIQLLVVSRHQCGAYAAFSRALNENLRAAALEGSRASVTAGAAVVPLEEARAYLIRQLAVPPEAA